MKAYIIDDRNIAAAHLVPVLVLSACVVLYNLIAGHKITTLRICINAGVALSVILSIIKSVKYLIKYIKSKDAHLRVDKDGIFINADKLFETIPWEQVKEIDFRRYESNLKTKMLCLYIYLTDGEMHLFSLEPYIDGINIFSLRRAIRHFSNRPDIVKNRSLIIL